MSTEPSSLMRAMEAEVGSVMGVDADADQLDLLRDDTGKLPANVFQLARQRAGEAKRGPGRPPQSRNKRSDQLAKLIIEKHGDPVMGMAAIYAMPLDQLVELLLVADGSKDREDRFFEVANRTEEAVAAILKASGDASGKKIDKLSELVDRLGDLTKSLKSKPGELALKALGLQVMARKETAPYVHGKQPIQVDLNTKADVILNIPGLTDAAHLAELVDHQDLSEDDLARLEYTPFTEVAGSEQST